MGIRCIRQFVTTVVVLVKISGGRFHCICNVVVCSGAGRPEEAHPGGSAGTGEPDGEVVEGEAELVADHPSPEAESVSHRGTDATDSGREIPGREQVREIPILLWKTTAVTSTCRLIELS